MCYNGNGALFMASIGCTAVLVCCGVGLAHEYKYTKRHESSCIITHTYYREAYTHKPDTCRFLSNQCDAITCRDWPQPCCLLNISNEFKAVNSRCLQTKWIYRLNFTNSTHYDLESEFTIEYDKQWRMRVVYRRGYSFPCWYSKNVPKPQWDPHWSPYSLYFIIFLVVGSFTLIFWTMLIIKFGCN